MDAPEDEPSPEWRDIIFNAWKKLPWVERADILDRLSRGCEHVKQLRLREVCKPAVNTLKLGMPVIYVDPGLNVRSALVTDLDPLTFCVFKRASDKGVLTNNPTYSIHPAALSYSAEPKPHTWHHVND